MYAVARKSLQRFVTDQIAVIGRGLTYVDFDAHGDIDKLPANDCVGLHHVAFTDQTNMWHVTFGITLVTYDDPNLLRMTTTMDVIYQQLRPQKTIVAYDPVTAAEVGKFTLLTGTTIFPIDRAETRAALSIQASSQLLVLNP